jgi:hypothetical protein
MKESFSSSDILVNYYRLDAYKFFEVYLSKKITLNEKIGCNPQNDEKRYILGSN